MGDIVTDALLITGLINVDFWPVIFTFHSQISVNQEGQSDKKGSKGWEEEVK